MRLRLAAAGMAASVLALGALPALADSFPRVTANTSVTAYDKRPARAHSTPFVLADPANPLRVMVSEVDLRTRVCFVHVSHDGGMSFVTAKSTPMPPAFQYCSINSGGAEAPMAWGGDGSLLVAMHGQNDKDGRFNSGAASLVVSRSTDEGRNWSSQIVVDNRDKDPREAAFRPHIVADRSRGVVYVSYNRSYTPAGAKARITRPYLLVSTDNGKTFGAPIEITASAPLASRAGWGASSPSLALAPDGGLFILYTESAPSGPPVAGAATPKLALARTSDRGRSFEFSTVQDMDPFVGFPELGMAFSGSKYSVIAVYEDLSLDASAAAQQVRDIFISRSTDGGKTFGKRQRITDDPVSGFFNKYTPGISTAPNGRVDIAWYDFRNEAGQLLSDIYATSSTDLGATWGRNVRVSDHSSDRHLGAFASYSDVRGAAGIASTDAAVYSAWDDTRNGTVADQNQDTYFAAVQLRPIAAAAAGSWLTYAAAIGAGLILAAVVLILVALVLRRRTEGRLPAQAGA